MSKKIIVFILLISALALSACSITFSTNQTIINGSGKVTTETRSVSGFTQVALNGLGNLNIILGDQESLVIEAEDNLMQYITTSVQGNKLIIGTAKDVLPMPTKPVNYTLTIKSLNALSLAGAGKITLNNLHSDQLTLDLSGAGEINVTELAASQLTTAISGAGSITLTGQATNQSVNISGAGRFNAADLKSTSADVTVSGLGSATVWSTGTLKAAISGAGNINYYDSPALSKSITGTGTIKSMGNHS
jgi:hypothetical protein